MQYSPRPRPNDTGELNAELIRNAALVAYEGRKAKAISRWLDESTRNRVVYVFDTDVIVSHCAPWRMGPADDEFLGRGYGQILPQKPLGGLSEDGRQAVIAQERRRAEAVCWLLATKALDRASAQKMPILQTRSHFTETLDLYESVKSRATAEALSTRKSIADRQSHVVQQMLRFIGSSAAVDPWPIAGNPARFLSDVLNTMQTRDLQSASRFVREWDAFFELISRRGGIFRLHEFLPEPGVFEAPQERALRSVCDMLADANVEPTPERADLERTFAAIVAPARYQHNRSRLAVDVQALTDVAMANGLLAKLGERSVKVVLITGDRKNALAVANARVSDRGTQRVNTPALAIDFVHHLWSCVDSITPDRTEAEDHRKGSELFSGFLAFGDDDQPNPEFVRRLVRQAIQADDVSTRRLYWQDVEQTYRRWDDFSQSAANLFKYFLADEVRLKRISDIVIQKLRMEEQSLSAEAMYNLAMETMARARDRTNVEFSEIGANSILDAHRHGVRNPPDLMFDSLKITDRIFKDLALPVRVFVDAEDFARRFERIVEDCYQPDPLNPFDDDHRQECYLKYLVLGALFASANRWIVAEQHAENAIGIVERSRRLKDPIRTLAQQGSTRPSNMSGREAYFLLAVAKRVRANSDKAYDEAERALRTASRCLDEDKAKGTATTVSPLRFDCEALALALSRYYWHRYQQPSSHQDDLAGIVFKQAAELRAALEFRTNDADSVATGLPGSTQASIATNFLQVAVISHFRQASGYCSIISCPIDREHIYECIRIIQTYTDLDETLRGGDRLDDGVRLSVGAQIICSPLMLLYAVVGAMIVADSTLSTPSSQDELNRIFNRHASAATIYDSWRFDMLLQLAKALLPR